MNTDTIKRRISTLNPGYFALVMATGIVSTACQLLHFSVLAKALFWLNNLQYFVLLILYIVRLFYFFPAVKADLSNPAKGAGFLTFVAGSSILGTEYMQGQQLFLPALILWIISLVSWALLVYSFLALVILKHEKPSPEKGINGSLLLLVVSTQSLVILGVLLLPQMIVRADIQWFALLSGWLIGILLYIVLTTIILYRLLFLPINTSELSPSYWIDTGAAAISCLAGVTLANALTTMPGFQPFIPVVHLSSLLLWAIATFWLPMLVILEIWRHVIAGFTYSPGYWSMVFPLGMYTVATLKLAAGLQFSFLNNISGVFIYVALAAWLIVFTGMLRSLTTKAQIKEA